MEHPNVLQLLDFREDRFSFFLVFDASILGNQLYEEFERFECISETMIAEVARQLLSVIVYFHAKGIVLGSLSPEVILLDPESYGKFETANMNLILVNTDISFVLQSCSKLKTIP